MNTVIRIKGEKGWRKCTKWSGCQDYENPEALYFGCIMYQIGQEQGMARKSKGQWITEQEFQKQKGV